MILDEIVKIGIFLLSLSQFSQFCWQHFGLFWTFEISDSKYESNVKRKKSTLQLPILKCWVGIHKIY